MNRRSSFLLLLLISIGPVTFPRGAEGHVFSRSYSRWEFRDRQVTVSASLPVVEFARGHRSFYRKTSAQILSDPSLLDFVVKYVPPRLAPADANAECRLEGQPVVGAPQPKNIQYVASYRCAEIPDGSISVNLFYDRAPNHIHFAHLSDGENSEDAVLDATHRTYGGKHPVADQPSDRPTPTTFANLIAYGVGHVTGGIDHIAFIIGLLLLGGGFWTVAKIATGFTLGHSLTLGLAAAGIVRVNEPGVEILVGVSIAYVALESVFVFAPREGRRNIFILNALLHLALGTLAFLSVGPLSIGVVVASALFTTCHLALHRRNRSTVSLRIGVAFLFGLIHGFAFAGALGGMLEGARLLTTLFGFNLGVEVGQILIIAPTAGALYLIAQRMSQQGFRVMQAGLASVLLATGVYWALGRALGI